MILREYIYLTPIRNSASHATSMPPLVIEPRTDILWLTYTTMNEPIITQTFDPGELDSGDVAQVKIWNQSIKDHDVAATLL